MSGDPDPTRLTTQLYADYVARVQAGEQVDFETFVVLHEDVEDDLRTLHASWQQVGEVLERLGKSGSFGRRLESSYGPGADPKITLDENAEAASEATSTVLGQLGERKSSFGRYDLKDEIARGGQGAILRVWDEDLRRSLAMKLILDEAEPGSEPKSGKVESMTLGRFLEEAQVTAQLDHPGIVPVHELGLDTEGRVYFTMKLVKGQSFKAIIDLLGEEKEGWSQTRALSVLLKVCEAMSYAHSKGVIHRDIKPANVMVGRFGEVYVMDWGLARVLGRVEQRDIRIRPEAQMTTALHSVRKDDSTLGPDSPLVTMDGDVVGTPAYMSPEQAMGELEEMGPQSDVYSAGMMLYQLASGRIPYVTPGAPANNYAIWSRVQEGPPKPLAEVAPETPPELVAIYEKATRRDPVQRYADMGELASELRAFLENRVVRAYKTGAVVEFKKWVQRNKGMAASIVAAILLTVAGLARTNFVQASMNRELSHQQSITEKVHAFLSQDLLSTSAAELVRLGKGSEMRAVMAAASRRLDEAAQPGGRFEDEPLVEASIRHTLGKTHALLREFDEAERNLGRALEIYTEHFGEGSMEALDVRNDMARLLEGTGRLEEQEALFLAILKELENIRRFEGDYSPQAVAVINNLASTYGNWDRHEEAARLYEEAIEVMTILNGPEHEDTLLARNNLAGVLADQERHEEAQGLYDEILEIRLRLFGEDDRGTLVTREALANLWADQGRFDEAMAAYEDVLVAQIQNLGEEDTDTLLTMNDYASAILESGTTDAGLLDQALSLTLQLNELTYEQEPAYLDTLASAYFANGETELALEFQRKGLRLLSPLRTPMRTEMEENLARYEGPTE